MARQHGVMHSDDVEFMWRIRRDLHEMRQHQQLAMTLQESAKRLMVQAATLSADLASPSAAAYRGIAAISRTAVNSSPVSDVDRAQVFPPGAQQIRLNSLDSYGSDRQAVARAA
jgi:hypothetical protein